MCGSDQPRSGSVESQAVGSSRAARCEPADCLSCVTVVADGARLLIPAQQVKTRRNVSVKVV